MQKLEIPHQEHIWRIFPGEGREIATSVGNLKLPLPFFVLLLLLFFFFIVFLLLVAWPQQATSDNTKTKDFYTSSRHICWARPPGILVYQNSLSNVVCSNRRLPPEIIWQLTSACWSNSEKEDDFSVRTLWTSSLWEDQRQVRVHLTSWQPRKKGRLVAVDWIFRGGKVLWVF